MPPTSRLERCDRGAHRARAWRALTAIARGSSRGIICCGLDPAGPHAVEQLGRLRVAGRGGEHQPFDRAHRPPGGVVVDQEGVAAQLPPVAAAVALQALLERLFALQRRQHRVGEPLGRLEGPAAADAEERVGGERGVADQRQPGRHRLAHPVGHVDLAEHRFDRPRVADRRRLGHVGEELDQRRFGVPLELGQAVLGRHRRVEGEAAVGGEGGRPVRVEEPDRAVGRVLRRRAFEVAAVGDAVVRVGLDRHLGELGDLRVATVGADGQAPAQLAPGALLVAGDHAAEAPALAQQALDAPAQHQLDPRRLGRGGADQRVEDLAAQVDAAAGALGRRFDPAPPGPHVHLRPQPARRFDRLEQAEPFDRRHARGLDEVRAHPLVGLGVGLLLDQGDAQAGAAELDGGRAAGEAGADDDRVVRRSVADDGGRESVLGHLGPPVEIAVQFVPYYTPRTMKSKSKEIKLTGTSYALMAVLHEFGEMTSYDIKQAMESSIQNFWPVPHTTAYEEPARLAAAGYLAARQEEGGRRRRIYALTDKGREALAAWAAEPSAAPPQLREEAMLKVFAGGGSRRRWWGRGSPGTGRSWRSCGATSRWSGKTRASRGSERTLVAGIAYEEKMLELLEPFGEATGPG